MKTKKQRDFIIFHLAISPHLSKEALCESFTERFNQPVTLDYIKEIEKNNKELISQLMEDESLALEMAQKVGIIYLASKLSRVLILQKIVEMGVNGHTQQVQTSRGTVVDLTVKNLPAATSALKQIKEELCEQSQASPEYNISVELAVPTSDEEVEDEI